MIELQPDDVIPLATFELAWRWSDPGHHLLPVDVRAKIRALSKAKAAEFADEAVERGAPRPVSEWDMTISAEWDDPNSVRVRLGELFIQRDVPVLVSWNRDVAVVTTWGTFAMYWDAFCYPSSDDVTVWSPGAAWTFAYRHFRVIDFRYRDHAA